MAIRPLETVAYLDMKRAGKGGIDLYAMLAMVLEPIVARDLLPRNPGFRPEQGRKEALQEVGR